MKFNPKARLDTSQIRDRRGRSSGGSGGMSGGLGGGGLPRSIPMGAGGGIGGLILVVIAFFVFGGGIGGGDSSEALPDDTNLEAECQTGEDANDSQACALVATVNSVQSYWSTALEEQSGTPYEMSQTEFFSGSTTTQGCGSASSDVGPFYCPVDDTVYIDTTFYDQMLEGQLGAEGGPFAEAYVIAHEYGHHIQDLLGTMGQVRTQQGPTSDSVRLELQADCYAGIWAKHATTAPDATGEPLIVELTQDDISRAIDAAHAVGDDRIQQRSGGRVIPEQWTHGSAQQREDWFRTGMEQGTLAACDTFSPSAL
ncbi:neutral zinc metallopeptidase [soil metagenome]